MASLVNVLSAKSISRRLVLIGSAAALTAAMMMPAGNLHAQTPKKIRLGEIARAALNWPRVIASEKNFFAEEGLEVEATVIQGSAPAVVQQVVGGSIDIGATNFEMAIRGVEGGADISIIGSDMLKFPFALVSSPDVKSAADLKGKRLTVAFQKDPSAVFFKRWAEMNGLATSDVDTIFIGTTPDRFAALTSGSVEAASLTQPFDIRALESGFNKLADFGDFAEDYGFIALIAQKQWLKDNPDTARGYLRAIARAIEWFYAPENREEAIDLMAAHSNSDRALIVSTYEYYFNDLKPFSRNLAVPEARVQGVLNTIVEMGDMQQPTPAPSKYLDTSYQPK
jgi:NitT/TauT family transport system substrate-binding protein